MLRQAHCPTLLRAQLQSIQNPSPTKPRVFLGLGFGTGGARTLLSALFETPAAQPPHSSKQCSRRAIFREQVRGCAAGFFDQGGQVAKPRSECPRSLAAQPSRAEADETVGFAEVRGEAAIKDVGCAAGFDQGGQECPRSPHAKLYDRGTSPQLPRPAHVTMPAPSCLPPPFPRLRASSTSSLMPPPARAA